MKIVVIILSALLVLTSCEHENDSLGKGVNSSLILGEAVFLSDSDVYNFPRDSISYFSMFPASNRIVIRRKKNHSEISSYSVSGFVPVFSYTNTPDFVVAPVNDSIVYLAKTPPMAMDGSHKELFWKYNLYQDSVLSKYSIKSKLFDNKGTKLRCSKDSAIYAFPIGGFHFKDDKLYFPLVRYISMKDKNFFDVKMPVLGTFNTITEKLEFTNIFPPSPPNGGRYNKSIEVNLLLGHSDNLVVFFSHSDTVKVLNLKKEIFLSIRLKINDIDPEEGLSEKQIRDQRNRGVFNDYRVSKFGSMYYLKDRFEYWRFAKYQSEKFVPRQMNNPLMAYSVYDTLFRLKYSGVLPTSLKPRILTQRSNSDEIFFYSNEKKLGKHRKAYATKLIDDTEGSTAQLDRFLAIGQCDSCSGWHNYLRKYHRITEDTIRVIAIPDHSCPSCIQGILTRKIGLEAIRNANYKIMLLGNSDRFSELRTLKNSGDQFNLYFDELEFAKYLESFTNPKIIVIAGDSLLAEEYVSPNIANSLESYIPRLEKKIKRAFEK